MPATGPFHPRAAQALVAAVVPMAFAIGAGRAVPPAGPGLSYTFTVTHHGLNGDGRAADYEVAASAQESGDKIWVQYFEPPQNADNNAAPDADRRAPAPKHYGYGAYYLFDRGSTVMTVVSPLKKKYFQLDQAAALQGFNKAIHVTFSDASIAVSRVQPDTMIDEVTTQHWRVVDDHSERITVVGLSSTAKIHSVVDYYFVPDLRQDFNPFLRTDDYVTLAGPGDYATKMRSALDQMGPGIPVLCVERRTAGKGVESSTVKRITAVTRPDIPASLFEVPAGVEKANNDAGISEEEAWLPDSLTTPLPKPEPGLLSKASGLLGKKVHIP
jgi:hypothetical protein